MSCAKHQAQAVACAFCTGVHVSGDGLTPPSVNCAPFEEFLRNTRRGGLTGRRVGYCAASQPSGRPLASGPGGAGGGGGGAGGSRPPPPRRPARMQGARRGLAPPLRPFYDELEQYGDWVLVE